MLRRQKAARDPEPKGKGVELPGAGSGQGALSGHASHVGVWVLKARHGGERRNPRAVPDVISSTHC